MTEISLTFPDWFLWAFVSYMLISAILTSFRIRLKYRIYKAQKQAARHSP